MFINFYVSDDSDNIIKRFVLSLNVKLSIIDHLSFLFNFICLNEDLVCGQYFSHVMKILINNRNGSIPQTLGYFRKKHVYYYTKEFTLFELYLKICNYF